MRYIELTIGEKETLEQGYKFHPKFHVRERFHSILLSSEGWKVKSIADLYQTRTRTIYTWMDRWTDKGLVGLFIQPGRGLKPLLSLKDKFTVETIVRKVVGCARNLNNLASELADTFGFHVSKQMLKRFLKKLNYSWKRFRKSLWKKQDSIEYEQKFLELKQLIALYLSGHIDLYFADESGFNMEGYVPYGWQPHGEYIDITPAKTKGTQVFGLMSLDNQLQAYTFKGSTTSQMVVSFLDDFNKNIKKKTVVVMDNAPTHRSSEFEGNIEKWKDQDLEIFFLPKYSPHLNPIEILWRMIKYRWLPYEKINSQKMLDDMLDQILQNFGSEYTINFTEHKKKVSNIFV
jgi:transposase